MHVLYCTPRPPFPPCSFFSGAVYFAGRNLALQYDVNPVDMNNYTAETSPRPHVVCVLDVRLPLCAHRANDGPGWASGATSDTNVKYNDNNHACPFSGGVHQSRFVGTR